MLVQHTQPRSIFKKGMPVTLACSALVYQPTPPPTRLTLCLQVLVLYEAKVLDSIQFLFDLGFVPPVALPSYRKPTDRTAVVEAVRRQINRGVQGDPLLLGAWPRGAAEMAAASGGGGGDSGEGVENDKRSATPLGLRVLGTSR